MGPCIIMHEVMDVDKWHNNWPQDLVVVSLCIQTPINKIQAFSLFITYSYPYHNPTVTLGHSIRNVDISKPIIHNILLNCSQRKTPMRTRSMQISYAETICAAIL
ncbi:hypothetical protein CRENBAI_009540 [Crenichthys baileyi]|uniref:Uncharacterized protein n=1 Tax=Crenichthys baileyi TaxID=28760 RepID=A0AAV9S1J9_9TELE